MRRTLHAALGAHRTLDPRPCLLWRAARRQRRIFFRSRAGRKMAFDGVIEAHNGMLEPDLSRAGFGLGWKTQDRLPFQVYGGGKTTSALIN